MAEFARILVVDDDPDFVEAIRTVLESASYRVDVAYDGRQAMAKVQADRPDAIVLDIIMPQMDGFEACRKLKGDPELASIPVLMLTSLSQRISDTSYSVSEGLDLDAEDYVDKPVKPQELLRRVERLLARGRE